MPISALEALKGGIGEKKVATLDGAILDYMAEMLSDTSMNHDDLCESLTPLLLDTECAKDEDDAKILVQKILEKQRGQSLEEIEEQRQQMVTPKLLNAPVILLEKVKEYERSLAALLKLELDLKEDTMTNSLIKTFDDPTLELSEEAMKSRANNEKKVQRTERKGITREKTAATERNEIIERLTRAPVVLHPKGDFGDLLGGPVDIQLENVTMELGGLVMLEDASIVLSFGRRFGLIGRNGVGKTTLLKHIAAKAFPGIPKNLQILHIEQEIAGTDLSALETVLKTDFERDSLLNEEKTLLQEDASKDTGRLALVYQRLQEIDAYAAPARASAILSGLGFTTEMQAMSTKQFSGGWRMRISLALALFIQPDILLLDEPTNHLDLHAVLWLEDYLQKWKKTLIVVSHARDFLDAVTTDIVHVKDKKLTRYKGNYTTFEEKRLEAQRTHEKQMENQEKQKAHMQNFIDKFRASASRAKMVQSRIKAMSRLATLDELTKDPTVQFNFPNPDSVSVQNAIQLIDIGFGYDQGKVLFNNVNLSINTDSRICLVGPNGVGKSTLLKIIYQELKPLRGVVNINNKIRMERFSQHHVEQLNLKKSALEQFKSDFPTDPVQKIRGHLGSMGISGKLALQPIYTLSGGQKSRVALAKITYTAPHILLLDEPTNHLDLDAVQALIAGLSNFEGGVFVISHDETLITAVCDELWVMEPGKVGIFDGDFDDYKKYVKKGF